MRQKKKPSVGLTAGQSAYYVIRQNVRLETWHHWFPRHACTVLYTSSGCGCEHNVLNLPHIQPRSRFSAAGSFGQSEAASSTGWAGLALAYVRDVSAALVKATPPTTEHGRASDELPVVCVSFWVVGTPLRALRSSSLRRTRWASKRRRRTVTAHSLST